jgi:hypothetical protein
VIPGAGPASGMGLTNLPSLPRETERKRKEEEKKMRFVEK